MSEEGYTFRTATFGGFRKDDVLQFMEGFADQSERRQQELMERLKQAETDRDNERENVTRLSEKNAELLERLGHMTQDLDECGKAAEEAKQLQEELEKLRAEAAALREERDRLINERETLQKVDREFAAAKEHIAEIELGACQRADEMLRQTDEQAESIRAAAEAAAKEISEAAQTEAAAVRENAEHEAAELREQAEEYRMQLEKKMLEQQENTRRECEAETAGAVAKAEAICKEADRYYNEKKSEIERLKSDYLDMVRKSAELLGVKEEQTAAPQKTEGTPRTDKTPRNPVSELLGGLRK